MVQPIVIIALFSGAAFYLGNLVRKSFSLKHDACPKGCGCGKIDFEKIAAEIKKTHP